MSHSNRAWIYIGLGAVIAIAGLFTIVSPMFWIALVLIPIGGFLIKLGLDDFKKVNEQQAVDNNPVSSQQKVITDSGILKKLKEEKYDPVKMNLNSMQKNATVDNALSTWRVEDMSYIYWTDAEPNDAHEVFKDLKLVTDGETRMLRTPKARVNEKVLLGRPVNPFSVNQDIESFIKEGGVELPPKVNYNDSTYYREYEQKGLKIQADDYAYMEIASSCYFNESLSHFIIIDYLGAKNFDCFVGEVKKNQEFHNFMPSPEMEA